MHLIIDVLDPEPDRFHDAQPAPIKELCNHLGGSIHERNHSGDFFACHDNGDIDLFVGANGIDAPRQSMVEDPLIEEHQGIHRLILRGCSDISMHSQIGEEGLDLRFAGEKINARPHAVETDEPDDPIHIRSLGVIGVVV